MSAKKQIWLTSFFMLFPLLSRTLVVSAQVLPDGTTLTTTENNSYITVKEPKETPKTNQN